MEKFIDLAPTMDLLNGNEDDLFNLDNLAIQNGNCNVC
jgi:hypothetical protein